ncbi:hypothetical protein [Mucisphaera calidilacus]|uniref:hypothetical protein n=1 Tax=Mucisphaera calidilacus TaxID=2527982 RepID=UPI0011AA05D3|nr:hypothetical protein [Mucisphaera calidilacus]
MHTLTCRFVCVTLITMTSILAASCGNNSSAHTKNSPWQRITLGSMGIEEDRNFYYVVLESDGLTGNGGTSGQSRQSAVIWLGSVGVTAGLIPSRKGAMIINGQKLGIPVSDRTIYFLNEDYSVASHSLTDLVWREFTSLLMNSGWKKISRSNIWNSVLAPRIQEVN